jgi:hypothetical protein
MEKIRESKKAEEASLREAFARQGVDFPKEVAPLVADTLFPFLKVWTLRKAAQEMEQRATKQLQRYRLAVQLVTEDAAPFPADLKGQLKARWKRLKKWSQKERLEELMQKVWPLETQMVSPSLTREFHKHPAWGQFEHSLFDVLKEKNVTERQAYRLIALCLETYLPQGFTAAYKEDAIRHRLKAQAK